MMVKFNCPGCVNGGVLVALKASAPNRFCDGKVLEHRQIQVNPALSILISDEQLYRFFTELAEPLSSGDTPPVPAPEVMRKLFAVAARYQYWIGSPEENASIGILVG